MQFANVEDEYRKNKDLHESDLKSLQEWIQKQPHLPPVSDLKLAVFLHSCHWSLEQTKTTIEKFLTYRGAWPDFFANRNPNDPSVRTHMGVSLCTFFPKTRQNCNIVFYKLMDLTVDNFCSKAEFKVLDMCIMLEMARKGSLDDFMLVADMSDVSMGHALKIEITATRRIMLYLQGALPVRLKALHFIVKAGLINLIMPLFKPFMKKELADLLHFHDSYEALSKFLPLESLPADVGGKGPTTKELHENMHKLYTEYADFFVEEEGFVSKEDFRDSRPSYMDEDLGIGTDGSFKKLDID
ncbi:hypothetical protein PPYR_03146 [Photinus pyralis]|uniref:CRAL-TRIO domain-containing protein n=1 Tax=Photinus pyralis TaxID=7054 RepID=A0A5N4A218_PHOPY|nr:retinol-binding protein pinta-like [Photinus pyralis]KAB0791346.1 hypothetical protein PPYR_03146 [Photinus pyralis]